MELSSYCFQQVHETPLTFPDTLWLLDLRLNFSRLFLAFWRVRPFAFTKSVVSLFSFWTYRYFGIPVSLAPSGFIDFPDYIPLFIEIKLKLRPTACRKGIILTIIWWNKKISKNLLFREGFRFILYSNGPIGSEMSNLNSSWHCIDLLLSSNKIGKESWRM